jgi:hypothetical protein
VLSVSSQRPASHPSSMAKSKTWVHRITLAPDSDPREAVSAGNQDNDEDEDSRMLQKEQMV